MDRSGSLVAVLVAAALVGCDKPAADARLDPPLVRSAVASDARPAERAFSGVVSARVQSDLGFRVGGKVIERLVDSGQTVTRGQALLRLDRTDLGLTDAAQQSAVEAARARAVQTANDERRYAKLLGEAVVSAAAYDQIKATADTARAQLREAEAQARVAANASGYAVLAADEDGTVVETLAEPGQVVAAGQTVVRLAHAGRREASLTLPENVRPALGSLARATLYDDSREGSAQLRLLSDAADPATRTFEARYTLSGPAAAAPLGSTVRIWIAEPAAAAGREIPLASIYDAGNGPGVWIVGPQSTVSWRHVELASVGEEQAIVTAGLAPGDRFVALGAHQLHEGERVRTEPASSGGVAAGAAPALATVR